MTAYLTSTLHDIQHIFVDEKRLSFGLEKYTAFTKSWQKATMLISCMSQPRSPTIIKMTKFV